MLFLIPFVQNIQGTPSHASLHSPVFVQGPRARMINPIACRRGWVCDEDGLVVPYKRCPRGYYCWKAKLQMEGGGSGNET